MLQHYLKIACRNLLKYRFYSFVNILGLFAGIMFTLLIGAYIWSELQANTQLRNAKNQYFLPSTWKDPNLGPEITTLGPLPKQLKEQYPQLVANYYRFYSFTSIASKGEKHLREHMQLGDSTFFSMFGFPLLYGNAATALKDPFAVVITKDMAIKYFGRTDVVGQTISIQNAANQSHEFTVTGVLEEMGQNLVTEINDESHNTFFISPLSSSYFKWDPEDWNNIYVPGFIELQKDVTAADLEKPIRQLIMNNPTDDITKQNLSVTPVQLKAYHLQRNNGLITRMLYTMSFVGLFILLMAVVNFVNIAMSRAGTRIREIGVRKVLGGMRKQLIWQFLAESMVVVAVATMLALLFYPTVSPLFQQLVGKLVPALSAFPAAFIAVPFVLVLLVGLLAGVYPAFVLSAMQAVDAVKGKLKTVKEHTLLRKSLVGFQFSVAIVVLIAAFIVTQQVTHFFGKELGYDKEYVVSSQLPRDWSPAGVNRMLAARNDFAGMSEVRSVSLSYEIPNGMNSFSPLLYRDGMDSSQAIAMQEMTTDEKYLSVYNIPLKAGRFFDGTGADTVSVVLNENAVHALGWKDAEAAVGQKVRFPYSPAVCNVAGVVGNYQFSSMQKQIPPVVFFSVKAMNQYRFLSFKVTPGNVAGSLEAISKKWAAILPASSFEYVFMDDTLKKIYSSEIQLKRAAYVATVLSLIIAFLGILGLVAMSIHKRVKEIGIRKVLGASFTSIILLFVKEFTVVMGIAALIACPVAYLLMHNWLNNYVSRIDITALPFICSVLALSVLTVILITVQTSKTANNKPVKSLRAE
ncbi:MAG: ABC transporter permease [Chitinophagaceae bacterium]